MLKARAGIRIFAKLAPDPLSAVISLSSESRPKAINVATRTAMGEARARIHAVFRPRYSRTTERGSPFPKNRSTALRKKLVNRRNTRIRSP